MSNVPPKLLLISDAFHHFKDTWPTVCFAPQQKKAKNQTLQTTKLKSRTPSYFIFPSRMHIFNLTWNATSDKSKSILYLHTYFAHSFIMKSRVFFLFFCRSVCQLVCWSFSLSVYLSVCRRFSFSFLKWFVLERGEYSFECKFHSEKTQPSSSFNEFSSQVQ